MHVCCFQAGICFVDIAYLIAILPTLVFEFRKVKDRVVARSYSRVARNSKDHRFKIDRTE